MACNTGAGGSSGDCGCEGCESPPREGSPEPVVTPPDTRKDQKPQQASPPSAKGNQSEAPADSQAGGGDGAGALSPKGAPLPIKDAQFDVPKQDVVGKGGGQKCVAKCDCLPTHAPFTPPQEPAGMDRVTPDLGTPPKGQVAEGASPPPEVAPLWALTFTVPNSPGTCSGHPTGACAFPGSMFSGQLTRGYGEQGFRMAPGPGGADPAGEGISGQSMGGGRPQESVAGLRVAGGHSVVGKEVELPGDSHAPLASKAAPKEAQEPERMKGTGSGGVTVAGRRTDEEPDSEVAGGQPLASPAGQMSGGPLPSLPDEPPPRRREEEGHRPPGGTTGAGVADSSTQPPSVPILSTITPVHSSPLREFRAEPYLSPQDSVIAAVDPSRFERPWFPPVLAPPTSGDFDLGGSDLGPGGGVLATPGPSLDDGHRGAKWLTEFHSPHSEPWSVDWQEDAGVHDFGVVGDEDVDGVRQVNDLIYARPDEGGGVLQRVTGGEVIQVSFGGEPAGTKMGLMGSEPGMPSRPSWLAAGRGELNIEPLGNSLSLLPKQLQVSGGVLTPSPFSPGIGASLSSHGANLLAGIAGVASRGPGGGGVGAVQRAGEAENNADEAFERMVKAEEVVKDLTEQYNRAIQEEEDSIRKRVILGEVKREDEQSEDTAWLARIEQSVAFYGAVFKGALKKEVELATKLERAKEEYAQAKADLDYWTLDALKSGFEASQQSTAPSSDILRLIEQAAQRRAQQREREREHDEQYRDPEGLRKAREVRYQAQGLRSAAAERESRLRDAENDADPAVVARARAASDRAKEAAIVADRAARDAERAAKRGDAEAYRRAKERADRLQQEAADLLAESDRERQARLAVERAKQEKADAEKRGDTLAAERAQKRIDDYEKEYKEITEKEGGAGGAEGATQAAEALAAAKRQRRADLERAAEDPLFREGVKHGDTAQKFNRAADKHEARAKEFAAKAEKASTKAAQDYYSKKAKEETEKSNKAKEQANTAKKKELELKALANKKELDRLQKKADEERAKRDPMFREAMAHRAEAEKNRKRAGEARKQGDYYRKKADQAAKEGRWAAVAFYQEKAARADKAADDYDRKADEEEQEGEDKKKRADETEEEWKKRKEEERKKKAPQDDAVVPLGTWPNCGPPPKCKDMDPPCPPTTVCNNATCQWEPSDPAEKGKGGAGESPPDIGQPGSMGPPPSGGDTPLMDGQRKLTGDSVAGIGLPGAADSVTAVAQQGPPVPAQDDKPVPPQKKVEEAPVSEEPKVPEKPKQPPDQATTEGVRSATRDSKEGVKDPCKKDLWLGFFFEGGRNRGNAPYTNTTIQGQRDSYKKTAEGKGATGETFYDTFEVSATVPDTLGKGLLKDTNEFMAVWHKAMAWYCSKVCAYLEAGCDKDRIKIDIMGWSRGAIMAMYIAGFISKAGCRCKGNKILGAGLKVRFIGLIDPVDSGLMDHSDMAQMRGHTHVSFPPAFSSNIDSRPYGLPGNIQNAFVGYMSKYSKLGQLVFRADSVILAPSTRDLGGGKTYDAKHEDSGWVGTDGGVGTDLGEAFRNAAR